MGDDASTDHGFADPESAFKILSHDLRLEILLALWEAPGFSLSFAELRKAVGERDSGSFTYHLSKLQDHFVAETDAGYELQYPGHRVLDAIQSGVFHEQAAVGPVDLAADCRECGADLTFTYDTDSIARVRCPDCGNRALEWPFDPGGTADREPEEIADAFDRRTRLLWSCALDGICPFCAGRVDRELTSHDFQEGVCVGVIEQLDRYEEYFARDHPAVVDVNCERCSFYSLIPVGMVLLTRPAVVGRLHDARDAHDTHDAHDARDAHDGLDLRDTPLWDLDFVVDGSALSVSSTEPMRLELDIQETAQPLTVVVDESLSVSVADD